MTDELLDRVRASNPIPEGSTAPPFSAVIEHVRAAGTGAGDGVWAGAGDGARAGARVRRPTRLLAPALTVASALIVAAVSIVILQSHHARATHAGRSGKRARAIPARTTPTVPKTGMSGLVDLWGAEFTSSGTGVISIQQCLRCRGGDPTAHASYRDWLLRSTDGGRTWTRAPRPYNLQQPELVGNDGWAGGLQSMGARGGGIARYYRTRDGGRSWTIAPADAPNGGGGVVSVAGGEVWAVGLGLRVGVLHARLGSSRLVATTAQPIGGDPTNVSVLAAGPHTAYVYNGAAPWQRFVTHDDGRTWQHLAAACPRHEHATLLGASGDTVWANCLTRVWKSTGLARSGDGGRHWQLVSSPSTNVLRIEQVSARAAWLTTFTGTAFHTSDGGATWQEAWSPTNPRQASIPAHVPRVGPAINAIPPIFVAQSASTATVVTEVTRGRVGQEAKATNLALYRTTNGGQTWQASVVPLSKR